MKINKYSSVMITQRNGLVSPETADCNWQLYIDEKWIGYYKTKNDAEKAAQRLIYGIDITF